jgi:hypothetical protein
MTGLSFVPAAGVEMTTAIEFRVARPVERIVQMGGWQGVEAAPQVVPAVPEDPSAFYEEPERWDGLS